MTQSWKVPRLAQMILLHYLWALVHVEGIGLFLWMLVGLGIPLRGLASIAGMF